MFTGKHHDSPSEVPNTGRTIRDLECTVARVDGLNEAPTLHHAGILLQFPKKTYDFSDFAFEVFGKPLCVDVPPLFIAEMDGDL